MALLFSVLSLRAGPAGTTENRPLLDPPVRYLRDIMFRASDREGLPVEGALVELEMEWGQVQGSVSAYTDDQGQAVFKVEPVVENPVDGLNVRDRFLNYKLLLSYRMTKSGYVTRNGRIRDQQDFSSFVDPLYQGLDHKPAARPLIENITLPFYADYLDKKVGSVFFNFNPLIDVLLDKAVDFSLAPNSLDLTAGGLLKIGLIFDLTIDPGEMDSAQTAALLLRRPVANSLELIAASLGPGEDIEYFEFKVLVKFQSPKNPYAIPEEKTFLFRFPAASAGLLVEWAEGARLGPARIEVSVGDRILDMKRFFD